MTPPKPCKFHRRFSPNRRVRSMTWEFFTDDDLVPRNRHAAATSRAIPYADYQGKDFEEQGILKRYQGIAELRAARTNRLIGRCGVKIRAGTRGLFLAPVSIFRHSLSAEYGTSLHRRAFSRARSTSGMSRRASALERYPSNSRPACRRTRECQRRAG